MDMQKRNPNILLPKVLYVFEGQKDFVVHFIKTFVKLNV